MVKAAVKSGQALRGEKGRKARQDALNPTFTPEFQPVYDQAVMRLKARVVERFSGDVPAPSNDNARDDVLYPIYKAVKVEFEQAAVALRTLPSNWAPSGLKAGWPDVVRDFWDNYSNKGESLGGIRLQATRDQLASLDRVLGWIGRLQANEMQIVLGHTGGLSFRRLARIFGKSTMWVHGQYRTALLVIAFTEMQPELLLRIKNRAANG